MRALTVPNNRLGPSHMIHGPLSLSPNPIDSKMASCDNIISQCGNTACANLRLTRNNTLGRQQCAHNIRLMKLQSFQSTPDLTSTNSSTSDVMEKRTIGATDAPSHPDVILLSNYQPIKHPIPFQCHHHHQHIQNLAGISAGHSHKLHDIDHMSPSTLPRKTFPTPSTSSFLAESYCMLDCSCCRKVSNQVDDDMCHTKNVNEKQKALQLVPSLKSSENTAASTTATITSTRF